jgi:hypothetical protein
MDAQHSAAEYIRMIRDQGFQVAPDRVSFPYLWWSRSDLGLLERIGIAPPKPGEREETLVNLVASKQPL